MDVLGEVVDFIRVLEVIDLVYKFVRIVELVLESFEIFGFNVG